MPGHKAYYHIENGDKNGNPNKEVGRIGLDGSCKQVFFSGPRIFVEQEVEGQKGQRKTLKKQLVNKTTINFQDFIGRKV